MTGTRQQRSPEDLSRRGAILNVPRRALGSAVKSGCHARCQVRSLHCAEAMMLNVRAARAAPRCGRTSKSTCSPGRANFPTACDSLTSRSTASGSPRRGSPRAPSESMAGTV